MKFQEQFELQLNELITKLKNFPEDYYHIYYDTNTNKFEVGDEFDNICEITIKHGDIEKLPNNDKELKKMLIKSFKKTLHHLTIISKKLTNKLNNEIPFITEDLKASIDSDNIVAIGITYNKELYLTTTTYLDRFYYYPFYHCNDYNTNNNNEEQLTKEILDACINFKNKTSKII
jgi:hypothetical protein